MRAYVITTGVIFALIVAAHIWRIVVEGLVLARDPAFVMLTIAAGALSLWSLQVLRAIARR